MRIQGYPMPASPNATPPQEIQALLRDSEGSWIFLWSEFYHGKSSWKKKTPFERKSVLDLFLRPKSPLFVFFLGRTWRMGRIGFWRFEVPKNWGEAIHKNMKVFFEKETPKFLFCTNLQDQTNLSTKENSQIFGSSHQCVCVCILLVELVLRNHWKSLATISYRLVSEFHHLF